LLEKLLTTLLESGVTIGGFSHIVVYILQSTAQNQAPKAKTHFYLVHLIERLDGNVSGRDIR